MEILHSLPSYLQANAQCKLLVIDSVAFHFRHGFEDYGQRARALDELAAFLHGLATDFDLAVLLINHITTKSSSNDRQVSQERPALGGLSQMPFILLTLTPLLFLNKKVKAGLIQMRIG
ncbi:hypothetical protein PPTG_03647 [Phytophthora nicotianae INRA-310]|nr:hypothetical protein PPTG_03647 [Phytophthora nicotianae INRA-310]ETN20707.1 hypothetical protein PPTG_03647 [Phytophthora nicotianae INRA-310]